MMTKRHRAVLACAVVAWAIVGFTWGHVSGGCDFGDGLALAFGTVVFGIPALLLTVWLVLPVLWRSEPDMGHRALVSMVAVAVFLGGGIVVGHVTRPPVVPQTGPCMAAD